MTRVRLWLVLLGASMMLSSNALADPSLTTSRRAPVRAKGVFAQLEVSSSFLQSLGEGDSRALSASYAGRVGYRLPRFTDFFAVLEHDLWLGSEVPTSGLAQVLNWGGGMGVTLRHAKVRSSLAAGGSTMMFYAPNAGPWTTGFFVDVRPIALRFETRGRVELELVLLSFQATMPKIEGIPIVHLEFRSGIALEVGP